MATLDVPPKLPETTNLVLTNNKKDHNEIKAMKTRTKLENKIPPLKNLDQVWYGSTADEKGSDELTPCPRTVHQYRRRPSITVETPLASAMVRKQQLKMYHEHRIRDRGFSVGSNGIRSLSPDARAMSGAFRDGALNQRRCLIVWFGRIRLKAK